MRWKFTRSHDPDLGPHHVRPCCYTTRTIIREYDVYLNIGHHVVQKLVLPIYTNQGKCQILANYIKLLSLHFSKKTISSDIGSPAV